MQSPMGCMEQHHRPELVYRSDEGKVHLNCTVTVDVIQLARFATVIGGRLKVLGKCYKFYFYPFSE